MSKWVNEGETAVGNVFLKNAAQIDKYLGLYTNAVEPAETITLATITELAVANGYARIQLGNADWTESPQGVFTNLQKTFTAAGGDWGDVYGYFICDCASGVAGDILAVETFSDGPYPISDGSSIKVTPVITIA
jgi:hypothetical protein